MRNTIDMAREAGFEELYEHKDGDSDWICFTDEIKAFEALVRADERSECAKVCVKIALEFKSMYCGDEMEAALICEETIRARGNT